MADKERTAAMRALCRRWLFCFRHMRLTERLARIVEAVGQNGSAVLSCADLAAWIAEEEGEALEADRKRLSLDPDVADLCRLFRKKPSTVRTWIRSGDLRAYRDGKGYRCTPEAIEAFKNLRREQVRSASAGEAPAIGIVRKTA